MRKTNYLFLMIMPLLLVIVAFFLNRARGPFWLGSNLDPEYVYLLNAANLAGIKGVGHIDHPGTPVQVLGAVTIRAAHFLNFSQTNDIQTDVMQRPEYYLSVINIVMITLNTAMLLIMGLIIFLLTRNIWVALWLQITPFFSIITLQFGLTRVTPEPLLFFSSQVMVTLLIGVLYYNNRPTGNSAIKETIASGGVEPRNETNVVTAGVKAKSGTIASSHFGRRRKNVPILLFAVISGFGIANKVTFLPMIIIPLVILPKIRNRIYFLLGTALGFIIFTLPIVRMYPRFFGWIKNLITHSGHYGSGPSQLLSARNYLNNIQSLLTANLFFSTSLFLGLITLLVTLVLPGWRKIAGSRFYYRLLLAVVGAQIGGLLMVSKHSSSHYLLPVLNLSGIVLLLIFIHLKKVLKSGLISRRILIMSPVLFLIIIVIALNPIGGIEKTVTRLSNLKEKSLALHEDVIKNYDGYAKVYYYRSSAKEYALKFGNDLSRSYHSETLQKLYKDTWFYDIWTKRFTTFDYHQTISFRDIRTRYNDKIVFQGSRGLKIPGVELKDASKSRFYEGIFIPDFEKNK